MRIWTSPLTRQPPDSIPLAWRLAAIVRTIGPRPARRVSPDRIGAPKRLLTGFAGQSVVLASVKEFQTLENLPHARTE